ncbi:MAG: NAD(P)H-hydrate epimerase, partial [Planctomycetota bacterium]
MFGPLTRAQVREVDRITIEQFHMPGLLLMEHAAIALRDACREMLRGSLNHRTVAIVCGGGNNGGDGYALGRLLLNAGADVRLFETKSTEQLTGDAAINAKIYHALDVGTFEATPSAIQSARCDLIVDALLGTGLT